MGPSPTSARRPLSETGGAGAGGGLDVLEGRDGLVTVPGLTVVEVRSLEQAVEVLRVGTACRTSGHNGVNPTSSRGHAIFQVTIQRQVGAISKLSLVDLAGSEKLQPIGSVSSVVLQELTCINLSLSTLGQCIASLVDSRRRHVPCRDSKLTRVLQDSFKGLSETVMCICISPTSTALEETMSSLKFADRAKRAVVPRRPSQAPVGTGNVASLMAQVQCLADELRHERAARLRLEQLVGENGSALPGDAGDRGGSPAFEEGSDNWADAKPPTRRTTASMSTPTGMVLESSAESLPQLLTSRSSGMLTTSDGRVGEDLGSYVSNIASSVRALSEQNEDLLERLEALENPGRPTISQASSTTSPLWGSAAPVDFAGMSPPMEENDDVSTPRLLSAARPGGARTPPRRPAGTVSQPWPHPRSVPAARELPSSTSFRPATTPPPRSRTCVGGGPDQGLLGGPARIAGAEAEAGLWDAMDVAGLGAFQTSPLWTPPGRGTPGGSNTASSIPRLALGAVRDAHALSASSAPSEADDEQRKSPRGELLSAVRADRARLRREQRGGSYIWGPMGAEASLDPAVASPPAAAAPAAVVRNATAASIPAAKSASGRSSSARRIAAQCWQEFEETLRDPGPT